jgi:transcriptional regulator with XRE-family HTH domain
MHDIKDESLGHYIRAMRKARGLTQEDLADAVGITKAYICIIERGEDTGRGVCVSPAKLEAIAIALHVPAEEIFNRAHILPMGTRLIRDGASSTYNSDMRDLTSSPERDWAELCAAGFSGLPGNVRDEIKRYVADRARECEPSAAAGV